MNHFGLIIKCDSCVDEEGNFDIHEASIVIADLLEQVAKQLDKGMEQGEIFSADNVKIGMYRYEK